MVTWTTSGMTEWNYLPPLPSFFFFFFFFFEKYHTWIKFKTIQNQISSTIILDQEILVCLVPSKIQSGRNKRILTESLLISYPILIHIVKVGSNSVIILYKDIIKIIQHLNASNATTPGF